MSRAILAPRPTPSRTPFVIAPVRQGDAPALAALLAGIDTTFFRPHAMTLDEAKRIAGHTGRDVYLIGRDAGDPVAYGMLRGWDEGYETAMLGIGVRADRVRRGYGCQMMLALQQIATRANAPRVRLRVHRNNEPALRLYRSLGYREDGMERGELVMVLDVGPAFQGGNDPRSPLV